MHLNNYDVIAYHWRSDMQMNGTSAKSELIIEVWWFHIMKEETHEPFTLNMHFLFFCLL